MGHFYDLYVCMGWSKYTINVKFYHFMDPILLVLTKKLAN